jgi:hypothetical protein
MSDEKPEEPSRPRRRLKRKGPGGFRKDGKPKRALGRLPRYLEVDVRRRIVAAVQAGCTYDVACGAAGIERTTFFKWKQRIEDGTADEHLVNLFDELDRARDSGEAMLAALLRKHSETEWKAAAHILSVRHPEKWAKRERFEVSGAAGAPIGVQIFLPALDGEEPSDPGSTPPPSEG